VRITITIDTDRLPAGLDDSREVARILDATAQDIHADCDDGKTMLDVCTRHGGSVRVLDGAGNVVGALVVQR